MSTSGFAGGVIILGSNGGKAPAGAAGTKLGACLFTSFGLIPDLLQFQQVVH